LGVRPPGPSPGDAVSIKSSKDKRPKRSPGETRDQEGTAISALRTNDLDAVPSGPDDGVARETGGVGCQVICESSVLGVALGWLAFRWLPPCRAPRLISVRGALWPGSGDMMLDRVPRLGDRGAAAHSLEAAREVSWQQRVGRSRPRFIGFAGAPSRPGGLRSGS